MRDNYCDLIKTIYETMFVIKRSLLYSYNNTTKELPSFFETKDSTEKAYYWLKNTLVELQYLDDNSETVEHYFSLKSNEIPKDGDKEEKLEKLLSEGETKIDIDKHFENSFTLKYNPEQDFYFRKALRIKGASLVIKSKNLIINQSIAPDPFPTVPGVFDAGGNSLLEDKIHMADVKDTEIAVLNNNSLITSYNLNISSQNIAKSNKLEYLNDLILQIEIKPPKVEFEGLLEIANPFFEPLDSVAEAAEIKKIADKFVIKNSNEIDWPKVIESTFPDYPKLIIAPPEQYIEKMIKTELSNASLNYIIKSSDFDRIQFRNINSIYNTKPFGKWTIKIKNISSNSESKNLGLSFIDDIALVLKFDVN